jgi:hypothetical protein
VIGAGFWVLGVDAGELSITSTQNPKPKTLLLPFAFFGAAV